MKAGKKAPIRTCVGCRESRDKKELIRIVRTPEGSVELDRTGKKNGRGAYICPRSECLAKARKSRGLERSLQAAISAEVYDRLEEEMNRLEQS